MPASNLISLDVAIRNIKSNFKKISNEDVFLQNSLGRCLAEPIYSKIDNPKYDVSSMDGYAINFKDFTELTSNNKNNSKKTINFKVIGESSAGNPFEKKLKILKQLEFLLEQKCHEDVMLLSFRKMFAPQAIKYVFQHNQI
jgi:molybdopterin biosynthesis enzyme